MPMTWPVAVSGTWSAIRAMPKSVIFTRPSGVRRGLPGLSAAIQVRARLMPPNRRTATSPASVRDHGSPHRSSR